MGQQHDFYLVQSGNLVPRAALWRGFLACFQQPSLLRPANLDSSDPLQAVAGMEVLRAGGNAIDAAVAVFYMTSVVQQYNAGIGGGGYILAYIAKQNRVVFLNGAGPAPKLATLEFYQKLGTIPFLGPNSSIVPGMVGAFDLALKKYGTKDYKPLLQPAIRAAAEGHPLSSWSASEHRTAVEKISRFPSSVKILLNAGQPLKSGEMFVQKDLARALETIAREGADVFYRGPLARLTADFYEKQGGLLRYDDLASFRAEEAEAVKTTFRDLEVYQSAPNSQGIVMLMALNILEAYDLGALGHNTPPISASDRRSAQIGLCRPRPLHHRSAFRQGHADRRAALERICPATAESHSRRSSDTGRRAPRGPSPKSGGPGSSRNRVRRHRATDRAYGNNRRENRWDLVICGCRSRRELGIGHP